MHILTEPKLKTLRELVHTASREELIWMNGFLSGLVVHGERNEFVPIDTDRIPVKKITLLFGTETGNSKKLATRFSSEAKKKGISVKLSGLDQFRLTDLVKEEYLFLVVSTQGEGEPPAQAKKFYDFIHAGGVELPHLKYSILALGDSSYPLFCKAGEDIDTQLTALGAQRILPVLKCDVDFEPAAGEWLKQLFATLEKGAHPAKIDLHPAPGSKHEKASYVGRILSSVNLNDRGSAKQTYHIEIAVDEDVDYQPGDAIGIVPSNSDEDVSRMLALLKQTDDKIILYKNEPVKLGELLKNRINVLHLSARLVQQYAKTTQHTISSASVRMDLYDLLQLYPLENPGQLEEVLNGLDPIQPRLYSVSSAPSAHPGEIHVTVARDVFSAENFEKQGFCSSFLMNLAINSQIQFYVHRNRTFKPAPSGRDMILVGPGTGIAPFRSFLAERDATGTPGRNWLFFGEQHFSTDFLYQTEIQNWVLTDALEMVSLAFSRDQEQKIYVQDRLLEKAAEIWEWITSGAYIYICGKKDPMSKDVEQAFLQIIREQGNQTEYEALAFLENLEEEGRFQKDVY